jgi:hypothetical protein
VHQYVQWVCHRCIGKARKLGVGREQHGRGVDAELLEDLEENLECLTVGIPVPHMDDIPLHMQRNVVGVGNQFGHLLWKVTREVIFYNDYRAPRDD